MITNILVARQQMVLTRVPNRSARERERSPLRGLPSSPISNAQGVLSGVGSGSITVVESSSDGIGSRKGLSLGTSIT